MRFIFQPKLVIPILMLAMSPVHAIFPGFNLAVQLGGEKVSGKHRFFDGGGNFGETTPSKFSYAAGGLLGYAFELGTSKTVIGFDVAYCMYGADMTGKLAISTGKDSNGAPNTGASQGDYSIKMKNSMGGSVMGGMLLNPRVIAYAKIGYEIIKFSMTYSNLTYNTKSEVYSINSKGIVPSIGGALLLSPRVYAGAELSFPITKKLKPRDNLVPINGVQRGYTYRPSVIRVLFQLGLRLGG